MSIRNSDIRRLLKAFSLEEADRVPNFESLVMERTMKYLLGEKRLNKIMKSDEMKYLLYLYSEEESEKGIEKKNSKNPSWRNIKIPSSIELNSSLLPPAENLKLLQATGVDAATPILTWSARTQMPGYEQGVKAYDQKGLVKGWEDSKKVRIPPLKVEKMVELVDWYIEVFEGTDVGVGPACDLCYTSAFEVLGMENFMLKIYDDIKLIEHIMDIFIDYDLKIAKEISKRNIDYFFLADDLAFNNGLSVKPKFIKDLWVPRIKAMMKPFEEKNIPVVMHCCANLTDVIPMIINMGIKAIHPIQPNCNDIYALKKKYGDKICLVGNMDLAGVLSFGTPKEVVEDTKKHIDKLAPGGGYVVTSSHTIIDSVPPENYIAMIETAQTYGKY